MEPRIQYAKTEDGVNIAYWTLGEGTPLLATASGANSPSFRSWQTPEGRAFWEKMAQGRLVIRYDHRGVGNSDHHISEFSLESLVADIEAVADQANPTAFALFGYAACAPFAIAYATRHPERVSKLILFNASARGSDLYNLDRLRKAREMADDDPEFYLQVVASELGLAGGHAESWVSAMLKEVDPSARQMSLDVHLESDVTHLLPRISVPTLVLHRRDLRRPSLDAARTLAAAIPGAQLVILEGDSAAPYIGDTDAVISAIDEFLADGVEAKPRATPATREGPAPGGFATILFTDMESSTALTQSLGDAKAQELVRAHNTIVREALGAHDGTEIKHTGDGIMASFAGASSALGCAVAIQQAVAARAAEQPDTPLGLRVGLNAGEPVVEEQDLFGASVQLAKRICDHAEPGQILVSNVVRELAMGKGFLFSDIGEVVPKGFEEPVRLYEVRWREAE